MKFPYVFYKREFIKRMEELEEAFKKNNTFQTVCYLRYLCHFCYSINYTFSNDRLEEITKDISVSYLGTTEIKNTREDTVIFYDGFGLLERGLANIYVNALAKLGYKVVWILYSYAPETDDILKKYEDKKNISFFVIPQRTILERMEVLRDKIKEISPRHLLIYTKPDDVCGIGAISTISEGVERYLIDLTDHAFWLGKCATDWFVEFRNYGYNIGTQYRNISPDKMIILPYYPVSREKYAFEGLPFRVNECQFVFSGGSSYKIEGKTTYEEMVRYILQTYKDIKFVFASNDENMILKRLGRDFPNRFFHIGERRDLDAILQKAKFYLSTYPITGGLMTQYALQNHCIPITLCDEIMGETDPKTMMLEPHKVNFIFYKKEDVQLEIDRLMSSESYYLKRKTELEGQVISEEEFSRQLQCLLKHKETKFAKEQQNIDMEKFLGIYRDNATYGKYCEIIYGSRNKWIYKKHPFVVQERRIREIINRYLTRNGRS